jgi:chromosome segregation ATPase
MRKVDEILAKMRKGVPLKEIKKKYRSQSQLYEAIRTFTTEAYREIQQKQMSLSSLGSQQTALERKARLLNSEANAIKKEMAKEKAAHKAWVDEVQKRKKQLQQELVSLDANLKSKQQELSTIKAKLDGLAKIGVTTKFVARICTMEFESGDNLLERVRTASEHIAIKKELEDTITRKNLLKQEIACLKKQKDGFITEIQSQKNVLDESKLKNRHFREAISIMRSFFRAGYHTEDLKRIKDGLDLLQVKGNPALSIDRLVRGLENVKSLAGLEGEMQKSKKKLQTLQDKIVKAKGELEAIRDITVEVINKTRKNAVNQIKKTGDNTIAEIVSLGRNGQRELSNLAGLAYDSFGKTEKKLTDTVGTFKAEAEKAQGAFEKHTYETLDKFSDNLSSAMSHFEKDLVKWGNAREQAVSISGH